MFLLSLLRRSPIGFILGLIHFEEAVRFRRMLPRNVMERSGRYVIRLSLANETVILQEVLLLGVVQIGV